MTHEEAAGGGFAERYVAGRLDEPARSAFEAHFFECDECFAAVEAEDALAAGVRTLAAGGAPATRTRRSIAPWLVAAAAVAIAIGTFAVTRQRAAVLEHRLASADARVADLDRSLADARRVAAEGNVPLAILQTTRGTRTVAVRVPSDAQHVLVWLEDVPAARGETLDLSLAADGGRVLFTVHDLHPNQYGAVVAAFPAAAIAPGRFTVTLTSPSAARTVAAYTLDIAR